MTAVLATLCLVVGALFLSKQSAPGPAPRSASARSRGARHDPPRPLEMRRSALAAVAVTLFAIDHDGSVSPALMPSA